MKYRVSPPFLKEKKNTLLVPVIERKNLNWNMKKVGKLGARVEKNKKIKAVGEQDESGTLVKFS